MEGERDSALAAWLDAAAGGQPLGSLAAYGHAPAAFVRAAAAAGVYGATLSEVALKLGAPPGCGMFRMACMLLAAALDGERSEVRREWMGWYAAQLFSPSLPPPRH
jgi:hypothetical protein